MSESPSYVQLHDFLYYLPMVGNSACTLFALFYLIFSKSPIILYVSLYEL